MPPGIDAVLKLFCSVHSRLDFAAAAALSPSPRFLCLQTDSINFSYELQKAMLPKGIGWHLR